MKNSARKPAERTTIRGGWEASDQSRSDSGSSRRASILWAMTSEKDVRYAGSTRRISSNEDVSPLPSTPSFNSDSNLTASYALGFPMLSGPSKKKLFPASSGETVAESKTVKWPMPGSTRFLSMDVEVADAESTRFLADSRAAWPVAAQSLDGIRSAQTCQRRRMAMRTAADDHSGEFCCLAVTCAWLSLGTQQKRFGSTPNLS